MVGQLEPHWRVRSISAVQGLEFVAQRQSDRCAQLGGASSPRLAAPDPDPGLRVAGSGAGLGPELSPEDGPDVIIQDPGVG